MIYETFGNDIAAPFRIEEIVKTVVIPSEIRAGVASIDIQNETFLKSKKKFYSAHGARCLLSVHKL